MGQTHSWDSLSIPQGPSGATLPRAAESHPHVISYTRSRGDGSPAVDTWTAEGLPWGL